MSLVAASNGQYTHGVQEQLKLLQWLGSLLSHQISAIHNKGIVPLQRSSTHTYLTCLNHKVTLVADNLKRQWFLVVYFGIRD